MSEGSVSSLFNELKFTILLSSLSLLLGLVVIVGWYTHNATLIQVSEYFVPMQFNTALGFFLGGLGLLIVASKKVIAAMPFGIAVMALGLLTLVEYVFVLNIGIDQLFMDHYIMVETTDPGRMAPNTALCFMLFGIALIAICFKLKIINYLVIVATLGSVIVGVGVIALTGYIVGFEAAYGWGEYTRMAVHTSIGFMMLGSALMSFAWVKSDVYVEGMPKWIPIPLGVGVTAAVVSLWQAFDNYKMKFSLDDSFFSFFDGALLILGVVFSIMLSVSVSLGLKSKKNLKDIKKINIKLKREIKEHEETGRNLDGIKLHLQTLVETLPDLVWLKDVNGVYLACNKKFERFFGAKQEDIIGKTDYDFIEKQFADSFRKNDELVVISRKLHINEEEIIYADDGHKELLETIKTPMFDDKGKLIGVLGVGHDITQRKQDELVIRHTQKMDAVGNLTGGIAHDYNNMLAIILGYTELLSAELNNKSELLEYVKHIHHASERGAKLTKKLLSFSKKTVSYPELVDINKILLDERNLLEKTLTARINLLLELEDGLWPVWLDSGDFEDAIINMSINAMHAMESGGGDLIFRTTSKRVTEQDTLHLKIDEGEYVLLTISDTGIGMNEDTIECVFEPFFSTKGASGTGLGLSQIYGFVERSGGFIKVDSKVGKGTTFSLYFPRCKKVFESARSCLNNKPLNTGGGKTILLVDDEPVLLKLAMSILRKGMYEVVGVETAEEALKYIENNHVDLIISDVIMPDIDGFELANFIKEKYPSIKVQLVSGYTGENDDVQFDILPKPYSATALLNKVSSVLND